MKLHRLFAGASSVKSMAMRGRMINTFGLMRYRARQKGEQGRRECIRSSSNEAKLPHGKTFNEGLAMSALTGLPRYKVSFEDDATC